MDKKSELPKWLVELFNIDYFLAVQAEKDFKSRELKLNEATDLIKYFVDRVESGSIRSVTTYDKYLTFLNK